MRKIDELVKKDGKFYEKENAPKESKRIGYYIPEEMKITQLDRTVKTAYFFGEKTWSYSKEERDNYREEYQQKRAEQKHRNDLIKQLSALSTEELEKLLNNLQ